jgi:hypothetical protein
METLLASYGIPVVPRMIQYASGVGITRQT